MRVWVVIDGTVTRGIVSKHAYDEELSLFGSHYKTVGGVSVMLPDDSWEKFTLDLLILVEPSPKTITEIRKNYLLRKLDHCKTARANLESEMSRLSRMEYDLVNTERAAYEEIKDILEAEDHDGKED